MSEQLNLDLREGRERRDEGMDRVLDRDPAWIDRALAMFARRFLQGEEVTGEAVRQRLIACGLERPHHPNAWGAFTNVLVHRGWIVDTGRVTRACDPVSHACRVPIWRVGTPVSKEH